MTPTPLPPPIHTMIKHLKPCGLESLLFVTIVDTFIGDTCGLLWIVIIRVIRSTCNNFWADLAAGPKVLQTSECLPGHLDQTSRHWRDGPAAGLHHRDQESRYFGPFPWSAVRQNRTLRDVSCVVKVLILPGRMLYKCYVVALNKSKLSGRTLYVEKIFPSGRWV